jgi:hypothetical protein
MRIHLKKMLILLNFIDDLAVINSIMKNIKLPDTSIPGKRNYFFYMYFFFIRNYFYINNSDLQ